MKDLEKSGFIQEAIHKKAALKDGVLGDLFYLVRLNNYLAIEPHEKPL
ncbi:MAG: hypothetical protein OEX12_06075 [Gammaproteobacteria bacterium]|nr:hypothetical protein [Gammaproteobacteria bacterium]